MHIWRRTRLRFIFPVSRLEIAVKRNGTVFYPALPVQQHRRRLGTPETPTFLDLPSMVSPLERAELSSPLW